MALMVFCAGCERDVVLAGGRWYIADSYVECPHGEPVPAREQGARADERGLLALLARLWRVARAGRS